MNRLDAIILIILSASAISSISYFVAEIVKSKRNMKISERVGFFIDEANRIHRELGGSCSEVSIKLESKLDRLAAEKLAEMNRGYVVGKRLMVYIQLWTIPSISHLNKN